ncbi:MAG TPA: TAT-variant-translocated molybdopterin oxidoreductase [Opitutaceae bacterium]|nr:TAT-variant-translocated molybdopterin oxidoreductase [Opitutaceae bacterium]
MKRKVIHPAPTERELTGPRYWRSLDELADTPGFREHLEREFPQGASNLDGVDRRQFFKLMAASFALGGIGLAGCRRPESYILPYGKSVEGLVPGLPLYFATAMPLRKSAIPLLAETHQGRPTKLEGNPTYAPHGGASSLLAQASVLDLYDPDRATAHTKNGAGLDVAGLNDLLASVGKNYSAAGGAGLAFLADESSSPTRAALVARLKAKFPKAIWAEYEPVQDEPPIMAAQAAFGQAVKPLYQFAKARRIVSLDCDFLAAESGSLYYSREFAKGRRVRTKDDEMNRLYVAESGFTITGGMADHRLRLASSHMVLLAAALASRITSNSDYAKFAEGLDVDPKWLDACADDLLANKGTSLVVAGAHQPAIVHVLAYAINAALGNIGETVDFVAVEPSGAATLADLAPAITAGQVKTLVILGGNPAYNAPADLEFATLLKNVPEVIRYGGYVDETSQLAGVHIAAAHYLESWGDARTVDGTIVPVQPMILPLFGGLTEIEVLARIAGEPTVDPYALVFNTITKIAGGDAQAAFNKLLHDGLLENSAYEKIPVEFNALRTGSLFASASKPAVFSKASLEVRFAADYKVDDGRFVNNGWLQECPDPITRLTWDNAILISPRLAKELGVDPKGSLFQVARRELADFDKGKENAFIAEVTVGGRKVRGPLHIQPGLSNYTIVLPLGYGRSAVGHVGLGTGFNAYLVRTSDASEFVTGATITVTSERMILANTQEHWSMEGRDLVREDNFDDFQRNPGYVHAIGLEAHSPPIYGEDGANMTPAERAAEGPKIRGNSLYVTPEFTGPQQWGMSIDLNTCTGCNACVVACQAENNIPIVGKDQVSRGREMHWIRIDRYYSSGSADNNDIPEDPQASVQPVACSQCELAPCEMVCPVNATVHDEEGLNVMAYNRCIGTRYCANNCPYKVRRFNYFDWNKRSIGHFYEGPLGPDGMPELLKMVKNPEVTIRIRGVMEKCTYCVQRIEGAKIQHKVKVAQAGDPADIVLPDGAVRTACQQACPVEAIVFGNILNPDSAVSKAKAQEQDYALLAYLNTRPRTTYLGKLRNPNPAMPDYTVPLSRKELQQHNGTPAEGEGSGDDKSPGDPNAVAPAAKIGGSS